MCGLEPYRVTLQWDLYDMTATDLFSVSQNKTNSVAKESRDYAVTALGRYAFPTLICSKLERFLQILGEYWLCATGS